MTIPYIFRPSKAYKDYKKNKIIKEGKDIESIKEIIKNIKKAIKSYFKGVEKPDPKTNFRWEVILVDDKDVKNTWCMHGEKIEVNSGILEIANNKDALAALMCHEIAHSVERHGSGKSKSGNVARIKQYCC